MDLRERLRLLKAAGASKAQAAAAPVGAGAPPAAPETLPAAAATSLGAGLDGYVRMTDAGEAFYVESRYPIEYCRGPLPLESIFGVSGAAWELLGKVPATIDLRRAAFFDTETTGLAGGSGTKAFLVGLGFFEGYEFVVRQYFLRDYPEEEAVLEALAADLAAFEALVTFNGKSFDWPLMETRYRMSRRRVPMNGAPHLDLLHPARRVWRDRLQQCNLTNLEAQVLGVQRYGDVPGHLIPQLYFDYLRTGDAAPLADVILHNRLDIISLVSLGAWLGHIVGNPLSPTPDGELVCGDDLYALGRLFESRGVPDRAITCFEAAAERGVLAVPESLVQRALSQAYKRVQQHERALTIWTAMTQGEGKLSLYPYVELAKYYEHVARDYPLAREMATRALEIAERRRSLAGAYGPATLRDLEAIRHRLGRLDRKLERQG